MTKKLTEGDVDKAIALLKKMCIRHDAITLRGYGTVAEMFGVGPEELLQAIRDKRKAENREYMRKYMRRRRGSRKALETGLGG